MLYTLSLLWRTFACVCRVPSYTRLRLKVDCQFVRAVLFHLTFAKQLTLHLSRLCKLRHIVTINSKPRDLHLHAD